MNKSVLKILVSKFYPVLSFEAAQELENTFYYEMNKLITAHIIADQHNWTEYLQTQIPLIISAKDSKSASEIGSAIADWAQATAEKSMKTIQYKMRADKLQHQIIVCSLFLPYRQAATLLRNWTDHREDLETKMTLSIAYLLQELTIAQAHKLEAPKTNNWVLPAVLNSKIPIPEG